MIGIDVTPLLLERRRGVARALMLLLEGMARIERPDPIVLLAPREPTSDDALPILDGVRVVKASSARQFRRRARPIAAELDLFVAPWLASVRTDPQTAVLVHELPFVRLGPIEGRLRALRQRTWLRRHVRAGARLVVPSHATRDDILELHPEAEDRVHVIPHGFDPGPWAAAACEPSDPPYAIVVGTGVGAAGEPKKGVDRVPPLRDALAGRLDVRVVGDDHIADDDLRRIVASARVLVCPSRSEGFGFPLLEAMAAGVPVVTTDGGALPEVAAGAALVVDGSPCALADATLSAAFDDAVRASLVALGRERSTEFPVENSARAWMNVLSQSGAVS